MLKRKEETKKYFIFDNHVSEREEEKSESYFALHCHHHVSILEGRHYVEKEENDKVKVTWSSKRGGTAVTNLFIWFLTSETVSELGLSDRSRCQFVDPRLETMSGVYLVLVLLYENLVVVPVVVCRSLLPQMPPASPIEDRGMAIPIEDRDRAIPERLRLCGVIVKGLPVSLMWRKNDSVGP
ncbi:hypothetical protein DY000_02047378 [Brassica cretica]|uniref:Ig-like domain-containing protein n=1 Tax=Brassica cretica TaxID=69181 RepID=A0ABQ7EWV4_BRACR|nr:hypothetical protein DY000_02047378 [Brassica cretica]